MPHISLTDWMRHCVDDGWTAASLPELEKIWRDHFHADEEPLGFVVKYRNLKIGEDFAFWSDAYLWALENYKGTTLNWRVEAAPAGT